MKKIAHFALFLALTLPSWGQNAKEIIQKAEDKMRGESLIAEMKVTTVRPKWSRDMTIKSWSRGEDYSVILVTSPAKEKGTAFLKIEKEIWNWVPTIERIIKMPPSMMMQSWMGTDLTNDDLVKQSSTISDYEHKILKDSVIGERNCYKIELLPKPEAPVVWGKVLIWIDKKDFLQLRTEFYDEDNYLINVMTASNIKNMGGKLLPTRMEMIPVEKKGHKTVIEYQSLQFDVKIEDSFFTQQNIKKLRD